MSDPPADEVIDVIIPGNVTRENDEQKTISYNTRDKSWIAVNKYRGTLKKKANRTEHEKYQAELLDELFTLDSFDKLSTNKRDDLIDTVNLHVLDGINEKRQSNNQSGLRRLQLGGLNMVSKGTQTDPFLPITKKEEKKQSKDDKKDFSVHLYLGERSRNPMGRFRLNENYFTGHMKKRRRLRKRRKRTCRQVNASLKKRLKALEKRLAKKKKKTKRKTK